MTTNAKSAASTGIVAAGVLVILGAGALLLGLGSCSGAPSTPGLPTAPTVDSSAAPTSTPTPVKPPVPPPPT